MGAARCARKARSFSMQHLSQTVSPALPHPCLRALLATIALHKWKHQTLLSVAGGTFCYVLLVQLVF